MAKASKVKRPSKAKAKKPVDKAAVKAKADAAKVKAQEAAARKLVPIAKEINVRGEKAHKAEGQANDHRLAAALRAADAKVLCKQAGINFKDWVEKEIVSSDVHQLSYETVRKLASIGASDDPAAALEGKRAANAKANKKARAKKADSDGPAEGEGDGGSAGVTRSMVDVATEAFNSLGDQEAIDFLVWAAKQFDMVVVEIEDVESQEGGDDGEETQSEEQAAA